MFPQWAANTDASFNDSAAQTGGIRHLRFVTDASCNLIVDDVQLSTTGDDTINNTMSELRGLGYNRTDRKYLVWADANVYCGIGEIYIDDQPSQSNLNTRGDMFARADTGCWGIAGHSTEAHEVMHTLGGVAKTAPHATSLNHCYDESDRMCYADGSGAVMQQICPTTHENLFDCNHDDYFSTAPTGYLATHWNTASNPYLDATALPPPTLSASPTTVATGSATTVSWASIPNPSTADWIGLYSSSSAADASYLAWRYTTGAASGSVAFTIPVGTPAGAGYQLRLFSNNGYTRLASFGPLTIQTGSPANLSASPTTVTAGTSTTVSWSGISQPTSTDWVGMYPSSAAADSSFVAWAYTTGAASGSLPFAVPSTLPPGTTYQLRLFANDGFSRLATSGPIAVQAAQPPAVTASPTTVARGATTNVSWSGIVGPTPKDWIGLYPSGAGDGGFVAWVYTTGTSSGSRSFTVPSTVPPATTYQFRLYANDGFTRLATSRPITVQ